MHNGLRVIAGGYHGGWMSEIIARLQGHHEPQEEVMFHEILRHVGPSATMLELGGFWSYYSLWFLKGFGARRAIVLRAGSVSYCGWADQCCAQQRHEHRIYSRQRRGGERRPAPVSDRDFRVVQIPEFSVSDILASRKIEALDILHCDTQGAETAVIASCEPLLKSRKIMFGVFSTHAHQISGDPLTHQRCLAMLEDLVGGFWPSMTSTKASAATG